MSCGRNCNQGRACTCVASQTELANATPPRLELVRSVPSRPPIQVTGGRVPLRRRVRHLVRALFHFLTAEKADLS